MSYKMSEVSNKLKDIVCGLLVDPRVTESPVFNYSMIYASNMVDDFRLDDKSAIEIVEEDESIRLTSEESKTSITIESSNSDEFSFIEESIDNQGIKTITKRTTRYDSTTGDAFIETYYVSVYKSDSGVVVSPSYIKESFDSNGIEIKREHIRGRAVPGVIEDLSSRDVLINAKALSVPEALYLHKTVYTRTGFDTARFYDEDKELDTFYDSTIQLDSRAPGLMSTSPTENEFPERVEILPMSREDINTIISKVRNPKVREGLQILSEGRETYSYDSSSDPDFVRKGFNQISK